MASDADYEAFCATYPGISLEEYRQGLLDIGASAEGAEAAVRELAVRRGEVRCGTCQGLGQHATKCPERTPAALSREEWVNGKL